MFPYWLILAYPALMSLLRGGRTGGSRGVGAFLGFAGFFLLYNFISLVRYDTAGDWYTYNILFEEILSRGAGYGFGRTDWGFAAVNVISAELGGGLYLVNLVCSAILSVGVIAVAQRLPDPWLAIAGAVPYLLIVVGLGYIRQGAAIGFLLLTINALADRRMVWAMVHLTLATLFHVTVLAAVPFLALAVIRRSPLAMVGLVIAGAFFYQFILAARLTQFELGYLSDHYSSSGAIIRIIMSLIPASLLLIFHKRVDAPPLEKSLWIMMAIANFTLPVLLAISPSSTLVDRLGLYFSPIQFYMLGHATRMFSGGARDEARGGSLLILLALLYVVAVQLVFLVYADHAFLWVPYHSIFQFL